MNKIGARIESDASTAKSQREIPHFLSLHSRQTNVDRLRLHMKAVFGDTGGVGPQKFVAPGGAVTADDVDLAVRMLRHDGEVREQVKQARIEMMDVAGAMIAQEMIQLIQRFRHVSLAAAINEVDVFARVCVIKTKPSLG